MQPAKRSLPSEQQQTTAVFAQADSAPRSGRRQGLPYLVRRDGVSVFFPCVHFSTDRKCLTTFLYGLELMYGQQITGEQKCMFAKNRNTRRWCRL